MRRGYAAAGLLAAALAAALPSTAGAAFKNVEVGSPPPPFSLEDAGGRRRESGELLPGGVTVVVFWAAWSPRSREILADLEQLRAELAPAQFSLVAINVEHLAISAPDRDAARSLLADTKSSATLLFDEGLVAFNGYGTMAVPSSLVVDKGGLVSFTLAGYPMTLRSDLADAVRKALGLPTSAELRPPQEYVPKNHALMYYNFGRRLLEKGQDEKAVEQFRIAVERDPEFKKPYVELGLLLLRQGAAQEARAAFLKVREIDPRDPEAAYQAAVAALRAGRPEEAAPLFRELTAEFPDRGGYLLALALTHKLLDREGDYRAGVAQAAGVRPPEARQLYDLGAVAQARGLLELAADFYRRSLESAPLAAGGHWP